MGGAADLEHPDRGVDAGRVGAEREGGRAAATPVPVPTSRTRSPAVTLGEREQIAGGVGEARGVDPLVDHGHVVVGTPVIHAAQGSWGPAERRVLRRAARLRPMIGERRVTGFAGVLAIVLAETLAGAAVLTWLSPLWRETKRSYFTIWSVIAALLFAWPIWLAARAGAIPGDAAGAWSVRLSLGAAIVVSLSAVLLLARRQAAGRVLGLLSLPVLLGLLAAMAATGRQPYPVSAFQLLVGAAFVGSAYHCLFLGHWYLTDRKLSRRPIERATVTLLVATGLEIAAIVTGGFSGTSASQEFNPLLTAGALAPWIAIGMSATTLLIAALAKAALRGERASAVQSATGFYYLAVVTAFTAETAVKTRFLPG